MNEMPLSKTIAGAVVWIVIIIMCGFAGNVTDVTVFIIQSIICLVIILIAIITGRLYEDIPEINDCE